MPWGRISRSAKYTKLAAARKKAKELEETLEKDVGQDFTLEDVTIKPACQPEDVPFKVNLAKDRAEQIKPKRVFQEARSLGSQIPRGHPLRAPSCCMSARCWQQRMSALSPTGHISCWHRSTWHGPMEPYIEGDEGAKSVHRHHRHLGCSGWMSQAHLRFSREGHQSGGPQGPHQKPKECSSDLQLTFEKQQTKKNGAGQLPFLHKVRLARKFVNGVLQLHRVEGVSKVIMMRGRRKTTIALCLLICIHSADDCILHYVLQLPRIP